MFIYVIRHGEPDYSTDTLTELGQKQAELLAERFSDKIFDRIFSSPLGRAKQTAMPTCIKQNKSLEELPWLSEKSAFNAMSTIINGERNWWFSVQNTRIRKFDDAQKLATDQSKSFYDSVSADYNNFLLEMGYKKCDEGYRIINDEYNRIALFCHDGISRVFLSYALSIPFHTFCGSFSIPHSGVTVLNFESTKDRVTAPRCLVFSDLSHLYTTGMKRNYNNELEI